MTEQGVVERTACGDCGLPVAIEVDWEPETFFELGGKLCWVPGGEPCLMRAADRGEYPVATVDFERLLAASVALVDKMDELGGWGEAWTRFVDVVTDLRLRRLK